MKNKTYISVTMLIFTIVGVVHLWRAISGTTVTFGNSVIPIWGSWVAGVLALYLAYSAYKMRS